MKAGVDRRIKDGKRGKNQEWEEREESRMGGEGRMKYGEYGKSWNGGRESWRIHRKEKMEYGEDRRSV